MTSLLTWLKSTFPLLWSPRFWGVVLTATVMLAKSKGWLDDMWMEWLQTIFGGATVVGTIGWAAKKFNPPTA